MKPNDKAFDNTYSIEMEDGTTRVLSVREIAAIAKLSPFSVVKKIGKGNRRITSFYPRKGTKPMTQPTERDRMYFRD